MAIAMQSKPGPMLAMEPGTRTRTSRALAWRGEHSSARSTARSQLQNLSECTGITIEFDRRFDILQRGVRIFEAGPGQHDDGRRVLFDLPFHHEPDQQSQRRR